MPASFHLLELSAVFLGFLEVYFSMEFWLASLLVGAGLVGDLVTFFEAVVAADFSFCLMTLFLTGLPTLMSLFLGAAGFFSLGVNTILADMSSIDLLLLFICLNCHSS